MNIGILGAGQLGRMLAQAGQRLGYRFVFLDPSPTACAAALGRHLCADYDDESALTEFCSAVDVATFEFENVPAACAEFVAARRPLHPGPTALGSGQDRRAEKQMFEELGIPVPPYALVDDRAGLDAALKAIGLPAVLKRRRLGYDGKGQAVLRDPADIAAAWDKLGGSPLLMERFVPFERELSCIGVRGSNGATVFYPVSENVHVGGILHTAIPRANDALQQLAQTYVARVLEHLNYVGALAFEFFVQDGQLLANEIAPRVHNTGHWSIDASSCSQFENHLRAISGLPLGATDLRGPAAMVNFIGAVPPLADLCAIPGVQVHAYDKAAKPLRKVGHATVLAASAAELQSRLDQVISLL